MKRKILVTLMATAMVFSMVACSNTTIATTTSDSAETVEYEEVSGKNSKEFSKAKEHNKKGTLIQAKEEKRQSAKNDSKTEKVSNDFHKNTHKSMRLAEMRDTIKKN